MVSKWIALCSIVLACSVWARPAENSKKDAVKDLATNTVIPEKPKPNFSTETPKDEEHDSHPINSDTNVQFGIEFPPPTPHKPSRGAGMVARIIDDIFQIPISVLESVARLLKNPFVSKTPEHSSGYRK